MHCVQCDQITYDAAETFTSSSEALELLDKGKKKKKKKCCKGSGSCSKEKGGTEAPEGTKEK